MSEPARELTPEDFAELQKKFSEISHSIKNALAVMMALAEMSQRRPDFGEKLATGVLSKAPQIVSSLDGFRQALTDKFGPRPEAVSDARPEGVPESK
jgi:two-component sensor histidine kinase